MNFRRRALPLIACVLLCGFSFGQQGKLSRAAQHMADLNYQVAIDLYSEILEDHDVAEAKINLAECYRKVNDTENAEYWYGQAVRTPEAKPIHKLFYGQMLQRNGKCDLAKEWYQQFVEAVPGDLRGQYLVKACDYEEELRTKNGNIYDVRHLDFNSNLDDFGPSFYDGKLIFASERDKGSAVKRIHNWTGNPFLELFSVEMSDKGKDEEDINVLQYGRAEKFSKEVNTKFHEAIITHDAKSDYLFFTRNNFKDGKIGKSDEGIVKLKVFYVKGGNLSDEISLPFNSDEYSVAHPAVTPDGTKLYFASDMPGGFGGMDLYVSENENGRWGPPINLGPEVNTEGQEIFPYYHKTEDDAKLYFSSNGHIGLGGQDIYMMEDKGEEGWGPIDNLGYPANTRADDFGLLLNDTGYSGYFSSDRAGGNGRDDIYSFTKNSAPIEILVYDQATGNPIEGANVANACTGIELVTNEEGKVIFDVKLDTCCDFTATMEAYLPNTKEGCTHDAVRGEKVFLEIPLRREMNCVIRGVVYDQNTGQPMEGVEVNVTDNCEAEDIPPAYTDATGVYEFILAPNCCYKLTASKEGYFSTPIDDKCTDCIVDPSEFIVDIYMNPIYFDGPSSDSLPTITTPVFPPSPSIVDVKEGEPIPYLLHIYYDFDQAYIRGEDEDELNKLCTMLTDNPNLIIELGSHTDARGSHAYNVRLSQRRARSVVKWLNENCGISRDRLVPRGYGEEQPVNDCVNNVPCSEPKHQFNRRTEFKIIGCTNCDENVGMISKPKENPRVDPCYGCPF